MTNKELKKIEQELLTRKREFLDAIEGKLDQTKDISSDKSSDPMDKASDSYEGDLSVSLAGRGAEELAEINAALQKIKDGVYGKCASCGKNIRVARIRAIPFATLCVKCKEAEEKESGGDGTPSAWKQG